LSLIDLVIDKNDDGVPIIVSEGKELGVPLSLSHHGEWVGYSYCLNRD